MINFLALHTLWKGHGFAWGDFNCFLEAQEKLGGRSLPSSSTNVFTEFFYAAGLIDLGFTGYPFTWNNNREDRANIKIRLDRATVNTSRRLLFLNVGVIHLTAQSSDHRPIILNTTPSEVSRPKPFRFKEM